MLTVEVELFTQISNGIDIVVQIDSVTQVTSATGKFSILLLIY